MKDTSKPNYDIGKVKILEIGIPKLYSTRTKAAIFKADPELWTTFKETCAARGVSICHVLEALMEAWIQGQKAESTLVRPVTVNLTMQHVVERPRRMAKLEDILYECNLKNWPPCCKFANEFWKGSRSVGCLKIKDVIPLAECWRCYLAQGFREFSGPGPGSEP